MSLRELRKECEAGLADLPIPAPFSIAALVANMEAARGRTIVLHEMPDRLARVNAACGLRLKTGGTSFVLYRRRPTAYQTQHVILHELCHEWFDHGTSLDPEQLRRLLPVFDTSLITRVLGTEPRRRPRPRRPSSPRSPTRSGPGTAPCRPAPSTTRTTSAWPSSAPRSFLAWPWTCRATTWWGGWPTPSPARSPTAVAACSAAPEHRTTPVPAPVPHPKDSAVTPLDLAGYLIAVLMTAVALWRMPAALWGDEDDKRRRALWGCYAGFAAALWTKTRAVRIGLNDSAVTDLAVLIKHYTATIAILAILSYIVAIYGQYPDAGTVPRHVRFARAIQQVAAKASIATLVLLTVLFFTVVDRSVPSDRFVADHAGQWGPRCT